MLFPPSTISYKMVDVLVSDREVKEGRGQVDMWSLRWRPTLTSTFYGTLSRKVRRRHFIESRISTKSPGKRQFWPGSNIYFMRSLTSPCSRRLPLKNTIPYVVNDGSFQKTVALEEMGLAITVMKWFEISFTFERALFHFFTLFEYIWVKKKINREIYLWILLTKIILCIIYIIWQSY